MRKYLLILFIGVFLVGCGSSLKSSWNNFTAYYNTFYNARENFKSGLKKVNNQPVTIDPTSPVRIHEAPNKAGYNDFQIAIDKGAQVLRKSPDSKWVDDAILLIGKSYYYRQEFFSALQKFDELLNATSSPKMISFAIIWKSRTQLDLKQYSAGISFVEFELEQYPAKWPRKYKGEIQALAGQHHAMLQNWNQAVGYLFDATSNIQNKPLLGRTYFLLAQVLEQQERYGEAYNAFGEVENNFPDFEYLYWSKYKRADIARQVQQFDLALDIFQMLRNDDKYLDRRGRLLYEMASTYEMMGESQQAEQLFKNLLHGPESQQQSRDLQADIYFKLGKIYSDRYKKYQVAAAYFDSSSAIKSSSPSGSDTENPEALADTYGEYTKLQDSIVRVDSLLKLGSMSEQELDSALAAIRIQKRKALDDEEDDAAAIDNPRLIDEENATEVPTRYGYLNYKNADLTRRYKNQFRLRWGDRPLVDNWRRAEAIRGTERQEDTDLVANEQQADALGETESAVEMNLEDIPRTSDQRNQLIKEKANAQYSLGSLLFLNLNMPDSARHYFHKVLNNDAADELYPPAMYSLFDIFAGENNVDSLQYWGEMIIDKYPDTRYARRASQRLGSSTDGYSEENNSSSLLKKFNQHLEDTTTQKAAELRSLALNNQSSELAPHIFYRAIEEYIQQAKNDSSYQRMSDSSAFPDSLSDSLREDTVGTRSYLEEELQFSGAAWDSVRFAIQQFDTTFPNAEQQKRISKLKKLLAQEGMVSKEGTTCEELGISLSVEPNMDEFLSHVSYPQEVQDMSLSGEVVYNFTVSSSGEIQSYQLVSQHTSLGIEEAFEKAFDDYLQFAPLELEQVPDDLICRMSFPIQH